MSRTSYKANVKYKMEADNDRWFKSFDVGDDVMIFISRLECKVIIASFNKENMDHTILLRRSTTMWLTSQVG